MNTEITDIVKANGWLLYDRDCPYCVQLARRFQNALTRRHFELVPLQEPWVRHRLELPEWELLEEMRLLQPNGKVLGGADALIEIARHFWWTWPLRQTARLPAIMNLFRTLYRWIARHRSCASGTCKVPVNQERLARKMPATKLRWPDFLPLIALPMIALFLRPHLLPWEFMWTMAFSLYAGCKWLTYCLAMRTSDRPHPLLGYGYLLAWPGMNAPEFFKLKNGPAKPKLVDWIFALAKTAFGGVLLWRIIHTIPLLHPLVAGWAGMIAIVFLLHFGLFHLLSLAWRQLGVNAMPVMNNPLRANSLADFWGARWNTAFNELAFRFAFRPLRRLTPPALATFAVFVLSGWIHELVISLPARGGYGLPTLYFTLQALGVAVERSKLGQHLGLGHCLRGWAFTVLIAAGPAFWLFHPPFIHNVILPMLTAIGAT